MKTSRPLRILAAFLLALALPATTWGAINTAANRTALGANRTLDWTAMAPLGGNFGDYEAVNVSGFGNVDVSCTSGGKMYQLKQTLSGEPGSTGGNFSPNDRVCRDGLGFNVQAAFLALSRRGSDSTAARTPPAGCSGRGRSMATRPKRTMARRSSLGGSATVTARTFGA